MKFLCRLLIFFLVFTSTSGAEDAPVSPADMLLVPPALERPMAGISESSLAKKKSVKPAPKQIMQAAKKEASSPEPPLEEEVVAPAFPLSRYQQLWERSPFQLESIAPPIKSAGLAQRYALTGLAEVGGEPIIFLMERATKKRLMVKKSKEEGGVSLVRIDRQKKYNDSTATIRQGAEVGEVKFDLTSVAAKSPRATPRGRRQSNPSQVQPPTGVTPPLPNPNGQVQNQGRPPTPAPRVIRRRAIVPATP